MFTTDYTIDNVKGVEGIRTRNIDWKPRQVIVEISKLSTNLPT